MRRPRRWESFRSGQTANSNSWACRCRSTANGRPSPKPHLRSARTMTRFWADMRPAPLLFCFAAALALAGCAVESTPPPENPNAVRLTTEKDGRFLVLTGPRLRHADPFLGIAATNFYLLR